MLKILLKWTYGRPLSDCFWSSLLCVSIVFSFIEIYVRFIGQFNELYVFQGVLTFMTKQG